MRRRTPRVAEPLRSMLREFSDDQRARRLSRATVRSYGSLLAHALDGMATPDELTPAALRGVMRRRDDEGLRPRTLSLTRTALATFCEYLIFQEHIAPPNPMAKIRGPRLDAVPWRAITRTQARAVLEAAQKYQGGAYEHVVQLLLATGIRCDEICRLEWRGVDFEEGVVAIHGKGGKPRRVGLEPAVIEALQRRPGDAGPQRLRLLPGAGQGAALRLLPAQARHGTGGLRQAEPRRRGGVRRAGADGADTEGHEAREGRARAGALHRRVRRPKG
jgi:integrase